MAINWPPDTRLRVTPMPSENFNNPHLLVGANTCIDCDAVLPDNASDDQWRCDECEEKHNVRVAERRDVEVAQ